MHTPVRAEVVVDLDAIRHNVRLLVDRAAATGAATMIAVKADGYGHGAIPVARAAVKAGATWLGACSLAEAIALRDAGLSVPILAWLDLLDTDRAPGVAAGIDLAASSVAELRALADAADRAGRPARVHLKIDTGMTRHGCPPADWPALVKAAADLGGKAGADQVGKAAIGQGGTALTDQSDKAAAGLGGRAAIGQGGTALTGQGGKAVIGQGGQGGRAATGQGGQAPTGEGSIGEGSIGEGSTGQGVTGQGVTDQGVTDQGVTDQGVTDQGVTDHGGAIEVVAVWSHLACADEPGHKSIDEQAERFDIAYRQALDAGLTPMRHLANAAATLTRPDLHFDLVRPGIACYGLNPVPVDVDLWPAMTFRSAVAATKRVPAGESVGYGRTWTAAGDTTLALVPVGYADGVPRALSGRFDVWLAGRRRPAVGRVSMDQIVIDCGDDDIPTGAEVVLFGPGTRGEPTAREWADTLDTIDYEIVTNMSRPRVVRRYVGDTAT